MQAPLDETQSLRRCVRDLVALSTLPAIWENADRASVCRSLSEVLLRLLSADFVYVRQSGHTGAPPVEAARTRVRAESPERAHDIGQALTPWLKPVPGDPPRSIPNPIGEGTAYLAVFPIGHAQEYGVLAAGCERADFPTDQERLLLGVTANQVAGLLQRRDAEEALRKQSEWLRVTLASIGDGVITTDAEGRVTSLNPVAEALTGWTQAEATGLPLETVFRILHEDSRQPVQNPVATVLREGRVVGLGNHTVLIARDGTERPIDDSAAPIRGTAGETLGVVLIFRDVTDQRRAARKLRESEARKAAILASALDAIITCDQDGVVLEFNPSAEQTFGWRQDDVVGREVAEFIVPPRLREHHRRGMARIVATGEARLLNRRLEMPACRAGGTEFPVELTITRVPGDGPPLFTAYLRDLSARKRLENHRNTRLAVTQVLAEAASLHEAASGILQGVCENLGWDVGFFWTCRRNTDRIACLESYRRTPAVPSEFEAASRQQTFRRGEGLPGRVWATGTAAWLPDVLRDANFPRGAVAAREGLHGAFACPITLGGEILGVIEFLSPRVQEPDPDLLELMTTLAGQVGQFVERRRAEEERDRFFTVGTDLLAVAGFDGYFKKVNPAWEKVLGWTAQELTSRPWLEFVHPDDRAATEAESGRLFQGLETVSFENRYRSRSGEYRWLHWRVRPFPEEGLLYGAATDVTERRRSEAALRESEERLRLLAETIPQLAWMAHADGYIFWYNRRWYEYTGTTPEQMEGWGWQTVHDPAVLPEVERRWKNSLASGEPFDMVFPLRGADGRFRPFLTRVNPLRDEEGRVLYWFGTNTDISEQQQAADAARFLANASAALAAVVDYEGTLGEVARMAVPFFADWCAVDMAEPDGSLRRLEVAHVDPSRVELARELYRRYPPRPDDPHGPPRVLRTGQAELVGAISDTVLAALAHDEDHLRLLRELGLQSYLSVPLAARDKILGVITFVTSESGREYGGADLALAQDLARRAAVAIDNARLNAELRRRDREKDEFVAMLAHELRNPLAPVLNAIQVLQARGADDPLVQRQRLVIDRQARHMARLLDDLLDVSRITRGKIELRRQILDLRAAAEHAIEAARPLLEQRKHPLRWYMPPEPLYVSADATRLHQVIGNLLNNAAKYSDPGEEIALTVAREEEQAVLRVADHGVGIPADFLSRIFELFTQVDRTVSRAESGLGIGLTIVQRLVHLHGGTVEAHSEGIGRGSVFTVRLPLAAEHDQSTSPDAPASRPHRASAGRRVLVVDDNRDAAETLADLAALWGHDARVAHDGPAALQEAAAFQPEVILLDISMPGMDGYEVAQALRQREELAGAVLIALTGYGQEEDRRRSLAAGFDHHLTKPVDPESLRRLLGAAPASRSDRGK